MMDLAFIGLTLALVALTMLLVGACEGLRGRR